MTQFAGWFGDSSRLRPDHFTHLEFESGPQPTTAADAVYGTAFHARKVGTSPRKLGGGVLGSAAVAWVGRPAFENRQVSDGNLYKEIVQRFRAEGQQVLERLTGPFALALYDADQRLGLVATDRMGVYPVYVVATEDGVGFGSAPVQALIGAGQKREINPQAIFDYLYCHVVPAPQSMFRGVLRLLPGQHVVWRAGRTTRGQHWRARFIEDEIRSFESLREEFRQALRAAVAQELSGKRCGAFLSGGTDSSTVTGLLTELTGQPAMTFSIGFDAAGFDEMEYARLAARHFGARHHEYYVTPADIVEAAPRLAAVHGQPFGNSSAVPAYYCAKLARDAGVECLLAGDGGDELFGGNARYAKQRVFARYEHIPSAIRHGLLEPASRLATRIGSVPGLSKAVSYVTQASVPMPERLETYNLLNRLGFGEVLSADFLAEVDVEAPMRLNREAYMNPTASSLINRMLALDFKTTLADNDLPKVMQSCELAGMEVAFPMLDHRVVDFSLALPPEMKLKGTQLRYFFKEALRGFLPDEIIAKQKHGFGLPFGEWVMRHEPLRELTFDSLNRLKRRGWVRPQHIDRLKDQLLPTLPNYYGSLAWLLMMLEQWMHTHVDSQSQRS